MRYSESEAVRLGVFDNVFGCQNDAVTFPRAGCAALQTITHPPIRAIHVCKQVDDAHRVPRDALDEGLVLSDHQSGARKRSCGDQFTIRSLQAAIGHHGTIGPNEEATCPPV